jgi:hypothetical protein
MTFDEIKEAILLLTDAERFELLNWTLERFDDDGSPLPGPGPGRGIARATLSS